MPLGLMVLRKLPPSPQKNSSKDKLYSRYFSPRIRNLSTLITLIDSCFLLFSFFVVQISTRLWFLYKKNFHNHRDWNCLKKKSKSRTNWVWNNETDLFMLLQQIETYKVYNEKAHEILFKKKYIVNYSICFLGWSFLPWHSTLLFHLSALTSILQFIHAVPCYNL